MKNTYKAGKFSNLPLKSSHLSVSVYYSIVQLTLTQTFTNKSSNPLEVFYSFPKLGNMTLVSLILKLSDGSLIEAKVHKNETAYEKYQDAISQGKTGVLLNEDQDKRMNLIIGNLTIGNELEVELKVAFPLSCENSNWKLIIPFSLTSDAKTLTDFRISFKIKSSQKILSYSCNSNASFKLSQSTLTLKGTAKPLYDEDIILYFLAQDLHVPSCLFQKVDNYYYVMVSVIPKAEDHINLLEAEAMGEFIFLLDRSASMSGERIKIAKEAAILFIKSLPKNSFFNIVSFGSRYQLIFEESKKNNSKNVDLAVNTIQTFSADLGGTNIFSPLKKIFEDKTTPGYSKIVFLLTDGDVDDETEVIKLIKQNKVKVNSFGIGRGFDKDLIKKTAEAGNGISSFVEEVDQLRKAVTLTLTKCLIPALSSWQIMWEGENYPSNFGDLNFGDRFVMYSKLKTLPEFSVVIKCFDSSLNSFRELRILDMQESDENIYKLWAHSKILDLEKEESRNRDEIIRLSIESGVKSSLTSLFCEKSNEGQVVEELKFVRAIPDIPFSPSRHIAVSINRKNNSIKSELSESCCSASNLSSSGSKFHNCLMESSPLDESGCSSFNSIESAKMISVAKRLSLYSCSMSKNLDDKLGFMSLISLQKSSGYWKYSDFCNDTQLLDKIPQNFVECSKRKNAICTLMVLCYLDTKYNELNEEWSLIERKALKWLKKKGIDYATLKSELVKFL